MKLQTIIRKISRESLAPRWRRLRPFYQASRKTVATPEWVEAFATSFEGETSDAELSATLGGTCPPGVTMEADFGMPPRCVEGGMGEDGRAVRYPTMTEVGGGSYNNQFRVYQKWSSAALTQNNLARRGKSQQWIFIPARDGPMYRTSGETYYFTCGMWVLDDGVGKMHVVGFNNANQLGIWIGLDRSADWSGTAPAVTLEVDAEIGSWNRLTVEWEIGPAGTGYFAVEWLSGDGNGSSVTWRGDTRLAFWNATLCLAHAGGTGDYADDTGYFGVMDSVTVWAPQAEEWHATVRGWTERVTANGGPQPSGATRRALDVFCRGLDQEGLASKMLALNCFAPDSLTAALTPLIRGPGNDPWTNYNFEAGDLTVHGLKGDGATKYLDTGVPHNSYTPAKGYGMSAMIGEIVPIASGTFMFDVGVADAGLSKFFILTAHSNTATIGYNYGMSSITIIRTPAAREFLTLNDTLTTARILINGAVWGNTSGSYTTPETGRSVHVFKYNHVAVSKSNRRLSAVMLHDALSDGETAKLYGLVNALRKAIGGGYV